MARKYFTLISKGLETPRNGEWIIEFGDYDRECVEDERDYMKGCAEIDQERIMFKIISTNDDQASINAKVAELNA